MKTEQVLDDLIESARLIGATETNKRFGCFTQTDSLLCSAQYKRAAKLKSILIDALEQQPAAPAAPVQEPVGCRTLCELCVKRGYDFCANAVKTTPIPTPDG